MNNTLPTCEATGHKMYKSWSRANDALSGLKAFSKKQTDDLRVWECPECGKWHVGHFSKYIQYLERLEAQGNLELAR